MGESDAKTIDVFICKLEKKIGKASDGRDYIETVWAPIQALEAIRATCRR
jgi:DNA-binding response OmpR family regulator